jgi:GDP-D-mannose 3', 5'-epimerase
VTSRTALVTGAGGFIGGHLVARLLDEGYTVTAIDRKHAGKWWQLHSDADNVTGTRVRDLRLSTLLEPENVDEVYHLAADMGGIGYITNHLTSCATNVVDTAHLLQYCERDQRVFFASSACVYPQSLQRDADAVVQQFGLVEEDAFPADPEPGYGWEKLYGEQLMRWFREERGVETRVARYHNVAGPLGSWIGGREKAPAAICRKVAVAKYTGVHQIEIWGDGQQTRSFMNVEDCVTGTLLVARGDYAEPLNLGSDRLVTVDQLVNIIEGFAGVRLKRIYEPNMPQGVRGRNSNNDRMWGLYGWAPSNDLETWLEPLYRWVYDQVVKTP